LFIVSVKPKIYMISIFSNYYVIVIAWDRVQYEIHFPSSDIDKTAIWN